MSPSAASLPKDLPSLRDLALTQVVEIKRLEQMVRIQQELIRLMRIEKYGPKSEKLSDAQLSFLDEEPSVRAEEVESEAQKGDPKTKEKGDEESGDMEPQPQN